MDVFDAIDQLVEVCSDQLLVGGEVNALNEDGEVEKWSIFHNNYGGEGKMIISASFLFILAVEYSDEVFMFEVAKLEFTEITLVDFAVGVVWEDLNGVKI